MRALVSGMGGFVGIHLARALQLRNFKVTGFGIHPAPALEELENCDYHLCDLNDYSALRALVQSSRPDHVYHLAALAQPSASLDAPRDYYRINSLGTVHLLESIRESQLTPRVLVVSSAHVYEPPVTQIRLREDAAIQPRLPYGVSKWMSEQAALQYYRDYHLSVLIARPFNHSGPGQQAGYVIPDFARQIVRLEKRSGGEIQVGDLHPVCDFLHVQDVADAYIRLLERGEAGEIYNIASGEGISIGEILDRLLAFSNADCTIHSAGPSLESSHLVGDSGKLIRTTGWYPRKSVSEMLQDVLEDWRARTAVTTDP